MKNKMADLSVTKIVKNELEKIDNMKIDMGLDFLMSTANNEHITYKDFTDEGVVFNINNETNTVEEFINECIEILGNFFEVNYSTINTVFRIQSINESVFITKKY